MLELGRSLREARVRRGLELAQVAAETRIRPRYLRALEEERFELIPGVVYAKGMLRTYAEYVGLNGQLFLDEYNARFTSEEPLAAPAQLRLRPRSVRHYGVASGVLLLALAGALLGWRLSSSAPPQTQAAATAARRALAGAPRHAPHRAVPRPRLALILHATGGRCWLLVRDSNERGPRLFEGTLENGESRRFHGHELWLRIGAPWNLLARWGKRRLSLPQTVASVVIADGKISSVVPG